MDSTTSLVAEFRASVRDLSPAYFAMVMATGILSIGVSMLGMRVFGVGLFYLNVGVYVALVMLSALRIAWFAPNFFSDMIDHRRAPGFFTVVAATCILGNQWLLIGNNLTAAVISWGIALALWIGLTYTVFVALTVKQQKPTLDEGITGAWPLRPESPVRTVATPDRPQQMPRLRTSAERTPYAVAYRGRGASQFCSLRSGDH